MNRDVCTSCDGLGYRYLAMDIWTGKVSRVTRYTYNALPVTERQARRMSKRYYQESIIICPDCHGKGVKTESDEQY